MVTIRDLFKAYCENTSIHGFSYLACQGIQITKRSTIFNFIEQLSGSKLAKLFWIFILSAAFSFAIWFISDAVIDWINNPTCKPHFDVEVKLGIINDK